MDGDMKPTLGNEDAAAANEVFASALEEEAPTLDENAFIRRAQRRSARRTFSVSAGVVLVAVVLLALGWVGWRFAIDRQADRILDYYPGLAEMTMANNQVERGRVLLDFPSATMRLNAYRRVDGTIAPAGEIGVRFYPWGGETFAEPEHYGEMSDGRLILAPGTTPDLLFLEPPVGGGDVSKIWNASSPAVGPFEYTFWNARTTAIKRLRAAPVSATVEVAASFADVMTLAQLQKRLGPELHLAWGALRVGSAGESADGDTGVVHPAGTTWWPHFPGGDGMVGIPFAAAGESDETPSQREANRLQEFGNLAHQAPGSRGRVLLDHSEYLSKHGAKYYGAVVMGSPKAVLALAESHDVSTVTLGAVAMPW
jgi:hypothetical protein